MAKKKNELMGNMKDTMALGVGSMAGMGAMGVMSSMSGMPAGTGAITGTVGASMGLLNIGQMSKNAMSMTKGFSGSTNIHKIIKKKK